VIVSVLWNDLWYSMVDGWYPELLVFRQPDAWRRLLMDHSGLFRAIALRRTRGVPSLDRSSERALAHYLENLERIVELARAAAAGVVLLAPPFDPGLVDAEGVSPIGVGRLTPGFLQQRAERYVVEARALATRLGVPWAEHRLAVGSPPPPGLFIDFLHPSPVGHRVLARDLARWLVEQGLLPRTPAPGSAALRPGAEPRRPGAGPASPADPAAAEP
jgi:lysophospholipase L1-like esterase